MAAALMGANMHYRELASDIKRRIAEHLPATADLETLVDADPSTGELWQATLVQAKLRDRIDLFSDGPERVQALHALIAHITAALPIPSASRDAVLAHLIKKAINTLANKDTFNLMRWAHREIARDAALLLARTDLEGIHQTILPLAKAKAWFREVGLCAQLSLETMPFVRPIRADRIWSMLQRVESDVTSAKLKSAVLSDIVHALRESTNNDGQRTTKYIFLRILSQLSATPALPAKYRVTIMKELIHQRHVLPIGGKDDILEALLPMAKALPSEYQFVKVPLPGQHITGAERVSTALRVVEFADIVTPEKWCASLESLIDLAPPDTRDRAVALGSLAVRCIQHATDAKRNGVDPALHKTDYLAEFQKILKAIDTTVPAHHRFTALLSLHSSLPAPLFEIWVQTCIKRAAIATAEGPAHKTAATLMALWNAASKRR